MQNFYHFSSLAAKKGEEGIELRMEKETEALLFPFLF